MGLLVAGSLCIWNDMMQDNGINNSIHQTDFIDEKDFPIMLSVGNNSDF